MWLGSSGVPERRWLGGGLLASAGMIASFSSALSLAGCGDSTVPDDALVTLTVVPSTLVRQGPPSDVAVLLLDADGKPLGKDATVALTSSIGSLCPVKGGERTCDGSDSGAVIILADHDRGVAHALLFPGNRTGSGSVTLNAGLISSSVSVSIAGALLPLDATLELLSIPSVAPEAGGQLQVYALARQKDGAAAEDGSLITFRAAHGVLGSTGVLTDGGVANTTLAEDSTTVPDTLIASSGVIADTLVITAGP